ncbi:hypothetical protein CWM47_00580 [Spirosoma pollinicola]|uniref:Uncharacterized protein n=1 Tax=Spirosoma pollinicola TaxID=2057025 RepID=A0A2K8YS88_9BACT|nr:hypothetical protein CWM47_00580 [Spirosoma pollinicola]
MRKKQKLSLLIDIRIINGRTYNNQWDFPHFSVGYIGCNIQMLTLKRQDQDQLCMRINIMVVIRPNLLIKL